MPLIQIGDTYLNPDHIITVYDDGTAVSVEMTNGDKQRFFNYGATALRDWLKLTADELELRDGSEPLYDSGEQVLVNGAEHYVIRHHGGERILVAAAKHVYFTDVKHVSALDDDDDTPQPAPANDAPEPRKFLVDDRVRVKSGHPKAGACGSIVSVYSLGTTCRIEFDDDETEVYHIEQLEFEPAD